MSALPDIVNLDSLIALGGHAELARVVIVDGQDVWNFAILGLFAFEKLLALSQWLVSIGRKIYASCGCTFVGLKFAITSLTGEVALTLVPKVRVMFN